MIDKKSSDVREKDPGILFFETFYVAGAVDPHNSSDTMRKGPHSLTRLGSNSQTILTQPARPHAERPSDTTRSSSDPARPHPALIQLSVSRLPPSSSDLAPILAIKRPHACMCEPGSWHALATHTSGARAPLGNEAGLALTGSTAALALGASSAPASPSRTAASYALWEPWKFSLRFGSAPRTAAIM